MKYQVVSLMIAGALLVAGCSDKASDSEKENKGKTTVQQENVNKEQETGRRWKADASTKRGIEKMQKRVENFDTTKELSYYKDLSEELNWDMDTVFKKCSMKGEGHKKLHEYLLPLKKDIQALGAYKNKDSAKIKVREMEEYLKEFDRRFK